MRVWEMHRKENQMGESGQIFKCESRLTVVTSILAIFACPVCGAEQIRVCGDYRFRGGVLSLLTVFW